MKNEFRHISWLVTRVLVVGLLLIPATGPLQAGDGFRESGVKFLTIGGSGRALAMAETYAIEPHDPFVVFYNPAMLSAAHPPSLALAHEEHFFNAHGEYAAISLPAGRFGLGIGTQFFAVNNIPGREGPTKDPLTEFDVTNALLQGSISYRINQKVRVGCSVKGVFAKIADHTADGLALDLGGAYVISPRITLGAALNNLGPAMKFKREKFDLPSIFRLGGGYTTTDWTVRGEVVSPNNEAARFHLGGEYTHRFPAGENGSPLGEIELSGRGGYVFGYDTRSWSAGVGIGISRVRFDYAFVPLDDNLGDTHRFALVFAL